MQGYPKEVGKISAGSVGRNKSKFSLLMEMLHNSRIPTEKWKSSGYHHELEDSRLEVPAHHRRRLRGAGGGAVPGAVPLVASGAGRRVGATQVRQRHTILQLAIVKFIRPFQSLLQSYKQDLAQKTGLRALPRYKFEVLMKIRCFCFGPPSAEAASPDESFAEASCRRAIRSISALCSSQTH